MPRLRSRVLCAWSMLALSHLTLSCGSSGGGSGGGGSAPDTPTVVPNPPVGKVDDSAGFFAEILTANESAKDYFNMHKGLSTFDEPCKGELGKITDCYVEAEEQTLFAQSFSIHYHVPSDMCSYVSVDPFYFVNRLTKSTTSLTKHVDKNGNTGVDNNLDGVVDTDLGCYTDKGDPVCCVGEYPETTLTWDSSSDAYGEPSIATVDRTIDKCLGGPATVTQPKNKFGVPRPTFKFVEGKGISEEYKFEELSNHQVHPAWIANFFNPAQHSNGPPAAFAFDIGLGPDNKFGNPYYTITCHDSAWETLASIRVQIREWNTKEQYVARKTEPTKHDEVGQEPDPWSTEGRNDYRDWLDFETEGKVHPGLEYQ